MPTFASRPDDINRKHLENITKITTYNDDKYPHGDQHDARQFGIYRIECSDYSFNLLFSSHNCVVFYANFFLGWLE